MLSSEDLKNELKNFIGTEKYHILGFSNIYATDGVKAFCEKGKAFWLFTDIESYYMCGKVNAEFKLWVLEVKKDKTAVLTCKEDSDTKPLITQKYSYTDLPSGKWSFYIVNGIMMLPSEY